MPLRSLRVGKSPVHIELKGLADKDTIFLTNCFKLLLQDAIYRLRFYSSSLVYNLSVSNSNNSVAPIQKNQGDNHSLGQLID